NAPPCSATIGDSVWNDLNNNGVQDPGEPGLDGITVQLKDSGGNVVATTATDGAGFYQFTGLCPGTYTVDAERKARTRTLPTDRSVDDSVDFGFFTPAPSPLSASCVSQIFGTRGVFYSSSIGVAGGVAPYTFTLASGWLPPGLTLDSSTGLISGVPKF